METQELKITDKRISAEVVEAPAMTNDIVLMAMQKNYSPEFIEKMMELAERNQRNIARQAFFEAFAQFKEGAPPVKKDKYNAFFKSHYTSLGNLLDTYNPVLGRHGLSLQFPTPKQDEKTMTVECRLSHRLGHTEVVSMTGPIDVAAIGKHSGERSRNPMQDLKSTFTYLRAATCEAILGVAGTEGTFDNDGNSAGGGPEYIDEKQRSTIVDMISNRWENPETRKIAEDRFLKFMKVEKVEDILKKDFKKAIEALKAEVKK